MREKAMTNTLEPRLLPPGIDLGTCDEPVKANAWRNMMVSKSGISVIGKLIFPTEAGGAENHADTVIIFAGEEEK
jgi:hypothetical protein